MADVKISELSSASILQDNDNIELSQDVSGDLISTKASLLAIGTKLATGINFTSQLKSEDKTLIGAINEKMDWKANALLGAKNLNATPYYHQSGRVQNYVTWTVNADGSVTANGTASGGNSAFSCHTRTKTNANCLILPNGKYIFSGCPSGGSTTKYALLVERTHNGTAETLGTDTGDGVEITLNGDDYSNDEVVVQIICRVYNGNQASNLTFYPMVRLANDTDATWKPYAETNKELTDNKLSWVENGLIGAKNLNSYPYYNTSKGAYGVIWTDIGDGTVKAHGLANANSSFACHLRQPSNAYPLILPNGKYKFTGCASGGSITTYRVDIGITKNGAYQELGKDYGDGVEFTVNGDDYFNDKAYIQISMIVLNGYNAQNLMFKPMIRVAEDNDNTFQPYAPTNRELHLTKPNPESISAVEYSPTRTNHSQGEFIMYNGQLYKCLTSITSGSALEVGTNIQATNVVSEMGSGSGGTLVSGTLTAGNTSITLSDASITTNSWISPYTSVYGVNPTSISVSTGSVTLTFQAQSTDVVVGVEVK